MDITNAIDYAQLALKKACEENKSKAIQPTPQEFAKQIGELMYLMKLTYNEGQAHQKAFEFINELEAKKWLSFLLCW